MSKFMRLDASVSNKKKGSQIFRLHYEIPNFLMNPNPNPNPKIESYLDGDHKLVRDVTG